MGALHSVRRQVGPDPGPKILVVDDDEANLVAIRALLAELGHPIVTARSGEEALRRLLREEFAVILLDVRMPGMDGYETAELIRARDRTRHVPIIFLSGVNKEDAHLFRGYAAGAVDYVFKPIEPMFLRSKVAVLTQLHQNAQEIRQKAEQEKKLLAENLEIRAREASMARELEQSLMQQSLVLQSLPIALFVAPAEDGYRARRFVGGNIERLCGPDEANDSETIGQLWKDRIHPDDAGRLEHAIESVEQTGSYELEYRILCEDGFRWLYERAERKPTTASADLLGIVSDVSTRKRLEEELTHAQKLEAIGRMSGGIAHDFNNMLGVIMGSLDRIAATEDLSARGQKRLSLAMQAADSCADLTKRLLGFARRQALEPRELDIAAELERLRALFDRVLGEAVVVSTECAEGLPQVHLDPSQFESAMVNLLVNARDAMPEGGEVTISAARIEVAPDEAAQTDLGAGEYIRLSVGDTGCGMDEATRLRALEPFFTTKPPDRGTGLGLSTIYGFIRQSGGGVRIESGVGQGTAVHMYLPAFQGPRQKKRGKRKGGAARDLRGTRVLLVEDNEKVCETAASILEGLNCKVTSVGNARDALELFQPGSFDLLLTDCVMPGELDGPKLAAILRDKDPGLAILLTSGFHESINDLDRRTTAFIAKPYSADQLAEKIAEAMVHAGGGETGPP